LLPEKQRALINLLHHISHMLENNSCVCCLTVNFSKAFDTVSHTVLLHKISAFGLPGSIHDWIVSFLIWREQKCVVYGVCSPVLHITHGIAQGSGAGPTLYILMKSDLSTLSSINVISIFTDDISLIVPQYCDVDLTAEFENIQLWATCNKMTISLTLSHTTHTHTHTHL